MWCFAPSLFSSLSSSGQNRWLVDSVADQENKITERRENSHEPDVLNQPMRSRALESVMKKERLAWQYAWTQGARTKSQVRGAVFFVSSRVSLHSN